MRLAGKVRVYVGTYTKGSTSEGIYGLRLDLATGALTSEGSPTESVNPSFLALHPSGRFLYAVNELGETPTDTGGGVSAFAVDPRTGSLTPLNEQPSGGAAPCHLSLDARGRHLFVANYWGGTVAVLKIEEDGRLGPPAVMRHENGSHAHAIHLEAANRFAFAVDLGLDQVVVYRFDSDLGTLTPHGRVKLMPGAGPRHFAFHPDGRHAYVINELDSTVTVLSYDAAAGSLDERQTLSTLPPGFDKKANATAEVVVRPDGRFLYGSNRGHDSIAIFAIDGTTRRLTPAGHQATLGRTPRHFAIDPTGASLLAANQDSDTVVVFRVDAATGALVPVGPPVSVPRPVCVRMVPVR